MDPSFSARLSKAFALTPSDTTPVNGGHGTKAVLALGTGNVTVKFQEDSAASIVLPVLSGQTYPWNLRMVYTASAVSLVGFL